MGSEEGVELMLDPSELDMEPSTLQAKLVKAYTV